MTNEAWFNIWRNVCRSHQFDEQVYRAVEQGLVRCFVYLSSGQETIAAAIAEAFRGYKPPIFTQHRGHAAYISFGGDVLRLRNELLMGYGGDPMIDDPNIRFFPHSGLVADQVPIAVGYAFASKQPVVCFCGDATVEEDVFWPAIGFAATHDLPVLFVIEDNGLSVVTTKGKRRSWEAAKVAEAYDIAATTIMDDTLDIYEFATEFVRQRRPLFLEVLTNRKYRHVGIGVDAELAWDRLEIFRGRLCDIDSPRVAEIEAQAREEMSSLWSVTAAAA